jgi:pilus assembly protein CpaE
MAAKPTVVMVGAIEPDVLFARQRLRDLVDVAASERDPGDGLDAVLRLRPTMALLFLDLFPDRIFDVCRRVTQASASAPILVSSHPTPDRILQAMRAGASDFASQEPGFDDLARAVSEYVAAHPVAGAASRKPARLSVVFGCKGGSGATTLATNLARALLAPHAGVPSRVALLDLDFQMGDVPAFLDLSSCYTWNDLVRDLPRLDEELLRQALTVHKSGIQIVAQSDGQVVGDTLDSASLGRATAFLRRHFDHMVVDGLRDYGELALSVMDVADDVLLVTTQDIPSVKNAARTLAVFRRLGYPGRKVKLVVNRFLRRGDIGVEAIADALGVHVDATVANDFPTVLKAVNGGTMLHAVSPKAQVTRDIETLATLLHRDTGNGHEARDGRAVGGVA